MVLTPGCPLPPLSLLLFAIEPVVVEEAGVVTSVLSSEQTDYYRIVGHFKLPSGLTNWNLPTSTASLGADIPTAFPALILT